VLGLGEDEGVEFDDFADFFLDFHVVVEAVVADSVLLCGDGGGLGEGFGECWVDQREELCCY